MIQYWWREPRRDPELAGALRRVEAVAASGARDTDEALHARVMRAAGRVLGAEFGRPPRWWEWTVSWARVAVPVGMAAGIAAALVLLWGPGTAELSTAVTDSMVESTASDPLLVSVGDEWLLTQVIQRPADTRELP